MLFVVGLPPKFAKLSKMLWKICKFWKRISVHRIHSGGEGQRIKRLFLRANLILRPVLLVVPTQTDPPCFQWGSNIPHIILSGDRINRLCFAAPHPSTQSPPQCPLLSYTMELLLRPGGKKIVPISRGGGIKRSKGSTNLWTLIFDAYRQTICCHFLIDHATFAGSVKGGPQPLEKEINEVLGSKHEEQFPLF